MQKREQGKSGGGSSQPPAKRGRPFGSGSGGGGGGGGGNSSLAVAAGGVDAAAAPSLLLGPSLQVHSSFADQNNKRIVLALQSGMKSELNWALNTLTVLSFKEKEDPRKDATPLAKIPGLLDALLQVVDDWRDIAVPKEYVRAPRVRTLGSAALVTGFGNEYNALVSNVGQSNSPSLSAAQKSGTKSGASQWWLEEDGLFNVDDEGRSEKQQFAVAASNVIRNFSFMPENEVIMAQHRHCLESAFQCIEDHEIEDEELVTNSLEVIVNLAPLLDLRIFSSNKPSFLGITVKRAVEAIMGMLRSNTKAWHCGAAELIGRLIINPDNEPFLLTSVSQIHKRLVDLITIPAYDTQAAAIGALYNLAELNVDCRLKLAQERWAIDRLLKVIKTPHPVPEICRKAAMILESLVSEPQNRPLLLSYENAFAEILFSDARQSDTFARILYELTARPNNKMAATRGVWGM
ncbi:hypothetical protein MLD38_011979 [Melastoma candidum]|uniref:Uncharacterized protein n=1 Tax=Melastoma candidum TaxID=119954 RepID=A0ACB9R478_9MYRT|nr:hypothetical protein MLD38_011979 [Melastoma candidum]